MREFPARTAGFSREAQSPSYLTHKEQDGKWASWWYRLSSPIRPASTAPFIEKDKFRRGRTGSQIIPALYALLLISLPTAITGSTSSFGTTGYNPNLIYIALGCLAALTVATLCNRFGQVTIAGFIVVGTTLAFPMLDILTWPGGLNMLILPLFSLLVVPLVCAVSFLPEWSVFVVAAANIGFALFALNYNLKGPVPVLQQTAELNAVLTVAWSNVVTPIITVQIVIPVVAYLWVHSTVQALRRADRAEEIAKLEHDLALQAEAAAQQKHRLEISIQKIVETHTRVANGDFNARVPLTEDNVLWQISGALNNLLARMQRLRQDGSEVQSLKYALHQTREENRRLARRLGEIMS